MKYTFNEKGMTEQELLGFAQEPKFNFFKKVLFKATYWSAEIYGAGKELRRYGFYPDFLPIFVAAEHGPYQWDYPFAGDLNSQHTFYMLTFSRRMQREWQKLSKVPCFVITSPFVIFRRRNKIEKSTNAKGTVVFFGHSLFDIDISIDISAYIEQLEDLPEIFKPVSICMHFVDVQKGYYKPFLEKGFPVYTAGHWYNQDFIFNFYEILSRFNYSMSNHYGSYAFYSLEMGIPFSIWGTKPEYINISHQTAPIGKFDRIKEHKQLTKVCSMLKGLQNKITPKQQQLMEDELGIHDGISRLELARLLYTAPFYVLFSRVFFKQVYKKVVKYLKEGYHRIKYAMFIAQGRKPWTWGYYAYRQKKITDVFANGSFNAKKLPPDYGFRIDERIIEYPWLFSRLPTNSGRLLDAGSILNFDFILSNKKISSKKVFISTLAPEKQCFWERGISYIYEDLRETCFKNNFFDWVVSISTIEHIGMDNTFLYTKEGSKKENNPDSHLTTVKEYHRILKPGGVLYLSVPFGKHKNHGWFQVFDGEMLDEIIDVFSPTTVTEHLFRYESDGWRISSREESKDATFFDIHEQKKYDKDYAAAARAVVCLEMVK